jgi:hypothetical protein
MKIKVVDITETDAKIRMLRNDTAAMFMLIMAMVAIVAIIATPVEVVGSQLLAIAAVILMICSAILMMISTFCKTEIQALNIIDWPLRKYVLFTPMLYDVKRRIKDE